MTFEIEPCRLTSKDAEQPTALAPYTPKYPFKDLKPGQCFFVPAHDKPLQRRCRAAMWAYNQKTKSKLQATKTDDGRLCVFLGLDAIKEKLEPEAELRPTQFEFVQWMSTLAEGTKQTFTTTDRFTEFSKWIDEYNIKSGAKVAWEIIGTTMTLEVIKK